MEGLDDFDDLEGGFEPDEVGSSEFELEDAASSDDSASTVSLDSAEVSVDTSASSVDSSVDSSTASSDFASTAFDAAGFWIKVMTAGLTVNTSPGFNNVFGLLI